MPQRVQIPSTFDHFTYKMSSKSHCSSVCPGTVLSVLCLLLYSAGFIRIEVKFNDHEERLIAVEEVISHMKQGMADTSIKGKVCSDFFPLKLRRLLGKLRLYFAFNDILLDRTLH